MMVLDRCKLIGYRSITLLSVFLVMVIIGPGIIISLWWAGVSGCPPDRWTYRWLSWAYTGLIRAGWVPVTVQGDIDLCKGPQGVVIIANHQSSADIPLLGSIVGSRPHVWLYWQRFTHHMFLGFFVRHIGLPVLNTDPAQDARTIIKAVKLIKCGYAVLIFPEGGRYLGYTHDFLAGFELIARKAGCPIVPVYLKGVEYVLPPGAWFGAPHPINVIIGKPVRPQDYENAQDLIEHMHAWFLGHD